MSGVVRLMAIIGGLLNLIFMKKLNKTLIFLDSFLAKSDLQTIHKNFLWHMVFQSSQPDKEAHLGTHYAVNYLCLSF